MNTICKLSAIALLASSTSLMAQTFSGPYVGVSVSAAGIGTDASKTSSVTATTNTTPNSGNGPVGTVFGLGALELGYGIPIDKDFTLAFGATYSPLEAELDGKSTDSTTGSSTSTRGSTNKITIKNPYTIYVQPTFEINKDSAFFIKGFYSHADVSVTNVTTSPGDLEGFGGSAGLKVMLTKNAFIQAEASYTQFDSLKATKTATEQSSVTRTITANDPDLAEGRITIGYKF
jgi:opacity protein-like surface antigen